MSYVPNHPKYGPLPPWRIDAERFDQLLNVLPPGRHSCLRYQESFFLIERLSGDIVMWVVRIGAPSQPGDLEGAPPLYFAFNAPASLPPSLLQQTIQTALKQHSEGTLPPSEEAVLEALA